MRRPLGEGWYLVTADLLLYAPPDPEGHTAAGRRAWRAHDRAIAAHFADPAAYLIHLEGPGGVKATFPFEERYEALAALGIRVRTPIREKPGPPPKVAWRDIIETIYRLEDDPKKQPTQEETAATLGMAQRTLAARHKGTPWREIVDAVLVLRPERQRRERYRQWRSRRESGTRPTGPMDAG